MYNPDMYLIRQSFDSTHVADIEAKTQKELIRLDLPSLTGARIAVALGSRGVANIAEIAAAVVRFLKDRGAMPFLIPAMGSHGGATPEGQIEVLASYGISEKNTGAEIISSMDVVEIDSPELENHVFMARSAWESDGVVVINRIKPHTDFHGPVESGLLKMLVIGLGKHKQALEIHSFGIHGLRDLIAPTATKILGTGKILFGIGIVENSYDQTMEIRAMPAGEITETEGELLELARKYMPAIPVDPLDVVIVDIMGKDISGSGLDTNIIGRISISGEPEPDFPKIQSLLVTDLTEASHGNALGMGFADVITRTLADKIDFRVTYENGITSSFLERLKMPMVAESSQQGLEWALRGAGCRRQEEARILRIRNTLTIDTILISSPLLAEVKAGKKTIEVLSDPLPLFADNGQLKDFSDWN